MEDLVTQSGHKTLFGGAYAGRRVFVTGHTGFKGSWLTYWLLSLGAAVTGYALEPPTTPNLFDSLELSKRIDHNIGDVRDLAKLCEVLAAARPEIVLHLAAQALVRPSYDDPVGTFDTNVMGTVHILEAARTAPSARVVVNVTSDKCYENREWEYAYRENDPVGGFDPYSASKGCSELVTAAYRRSFFDSPDSTAIATARAGNVIGGGDWALDRIVPDCARSLSADEPIVVRNPYAVRPWQHVLEPLSGYLWLAARMLIEGHNFSGAWNFGPATGGNLTVGEVVARVIAEWGHGSSTSAVAGEPGPHEARLLKLDCSKAADLLGWRPTYDAHQAVSSTVRWYRGFYGGDAPADRLTAEGLADYELAARARQARWTR